MSTADVRRPSSHAYRSASVSNGVVEPAYRVVDQQDWVSHPHNVRTGLRMPLRPAVDSTQRLSTSCSHQCLLRTASMVTCFEDASAQHSNLPLAHWLLCRATSSDAT